MLPCSQPLRTGLATLLAALVLAGCATVGANYHEPAAAVQPQWSAAQPHAGSVARLQDWWQRFDDPVLARLQQAAESDSPTLAQAWGNIELARATLATAKSGASPTVSTSSSLTRSGQSGSKPVTTRSTSTDASWELDLFGKVRRNVEAADAQVQARRADWHDARVSLAAEVATDYVQYRACGLLVQTYEQEITSLTETTRANESLVRAGLSPSSDAALARATQASTTSALQEQRSQCELLVKSLANLTGLQDAELRTLLASGKTGIPQAPGVAVTAVPAQVLRQRPDVGSRERDLAAASATIGVAEAALYPSISLSGSIGIANSLTNWSFGPSLSLPIFDGGARRANVDSAKASYEVAYAQWRDTVRNAVTEVEKALVALDTAGQRIEQSEKAAQEYRRYLTSAEAERRAGTISLLTLEEARRQSLSAQLDLIALQRDRVTDWITLYRALGGGWDANAAVSAPASRAPLAENTK